MRPPAHVTSFYSFKGGVGRTLLLANVGAALARRGGATLLWDLDVEAPGMHHIPALRPARPPAQGFLEWLAECQARGNLSNPDAKSLVRLKKSIRPVPGLPRLHLLPAFGAKSNFTDVYQQIRWSEFLVADPGLGLRLFQRLVQYLAEDGEYAHILLDARTGLTDLGGITAAVLPHATVLVGGYGEQNVHGLKRIYGALDGAAAGQVAQRGDLPGLRRLVVVSPVPEGHADLRRARGVAWDQAFPLTSEETRLEVPFDSRLLFSEDLLVATDPGSPAAQAYAKVAGQVEDLRTELLEDLAAAGAAAEAYPEVAPAHRRDGRLDRGSRFEDRVARLLTLLDYQVEGEQLVDGNRVDLVARKRAGFRSECYFVECKDHKKPVGKALVETFRTWLDGPGARAAHAEGMFVARKFSPAARTYAEAQRILALTPAELERSLFDFGPYLARLKRRFEESRLSRTYVDQRVLLEERPAVPEGADLLEHGRAWARGEGKRLWLLLGDYGTGKTAFFQRFAYELARGAEADADAPVPLAIDLKEFPNAISLEGLLQEHMRSHLNWHGNPEILLHLLAAGRLVLLLDAFDEMGTAAVGRSVEDQFRQLVRPAAGADGRRGNRILLTCRTHFFRDQQHVKDVSAGHADNLVSRDSDLGRLARHFDAQIDEVLLFNDAQIRQFLANHLPPAEAERAERFIHETYDLPSLAPRPVLLEMIIEALPELIRQGGSVTPGGLYHRYTTLWLEEKAGGSLQTTSAQRKALLEILACELWGLPQHRIHHRQLTETLQEKCTASELAGLDLDRVDLELRTAAFLTRTADGFYGFSHKSFREFFFARHLLGALRAGGDAVTRALDTAPLSPESVSFLVDLMEPEDAAHLRTGVRGVLGAAYRQRTSENALRLGYRWAAAGMAQETVEAVGPSHQLTQRMAEAMPERAQLQGADLVEAEFPGAWLANADLSEARLRGANLRGVVAHSSVWRGADLRRADLREADLAGAVLDGAQLSFAVLAGARCGRTSLRGADFTAANLAGADVVEASFAGARCHATRFAGSDLRDANWARADRTRATGLGESPPPPPAVARALLQLGHLGTVSSAGFSGDGTRVVTGGADGTARIWDAASGAELLRLEGHGAGVSSAGFSGDGTRVVTGGADGTARIWDAASGALLRTLVPTRRGWLTLDADNRWRGEGDGPERLSYYDSAERSLLRTLWLAPDLPEMREPDPAAM